VTTTVVYLPERFSGTEAVLPYEVLSLLPGAEIVFASRRGGPVVADSGMLRVDSVPLASLAGTLVDVLYLPGGAVHVDARDPAVLAGLHRTSAGARFTAWACVGGVLLGAAGLLRGVRVAADNGVPVPDHGQVPVPGRVVVHEDRFVSALNATSTVDLALWIAARFVPAEDARAIQVGMEYDLDTFRPPFDPRPTPDVTSEERQRFLSLVLQGSRGQLVRELAG
jgi:transcriptional regulator GlxA family with amidase domain